MMDHRVRRNRGLVAAVAAAAVAAVIGIATVGGRDPVEPAPIERPNQIFAEIHGWIVYSEDRNAIWAVDPSRPSDQEPRLVTDRPGEPLGWSSDGTKLLIRRLDGVRGGYGAEYDLVVLNADGSENRVVSRASPYGSISSDGTQVVYSDAESSAIYTVGTDGGTPRLRHAPAPREFPREDEGTLWPITTYFAVFSPDAAQIAFFDGMGDWGHRLRVMNTDGTGVRTLHDLEAIGHIRGLAWSPDGEHLIFSSEVAPAGIWVIAVDGSGLIRVARGTSPAWSPDGTRISYMKRRQVYIANADGTEKTLLQSIVTSSSASAEWNPLRLDH